MEEKLPSQDFARAFGNALNAFLDERGITKAEAARRLGLAGKGGKSRLNTYCHDSPKGKRSEPGAMILYSACAELGFFFEYRGYKISVETLGEKSRRTTEKLEEQLEISFEGQINLTQQSGRISINTKRPNARSTIKLALKASRSNAR